MASPTKREPRRLPEDVRIALVQAVGRLGSQSKVATELGCSSAVVSQLLRDKYLGDVSAYADRIRGLYMAETVQCPVMGKLGRNHCLDFQKRPLAFTNPQRVALHQACKSCPNRREAS